MSSAAKARKSQQIVLQCFTGWPSLGPGASFRLDFLVSSLFGEVNYIELIFIRWFGHWKGNHILRNLFV